MRTLGPLLMVASLAACASDSDQTSGQGSDYCSTLESAGSQVLTHDPMALNDASELADLRANISTLESLAPVEVKAAWGVLRHDFDGFTRVMDEAGISFKELLYVDDNGKLPAGVKRQQFAQFLRGLEALDRSEIDKATETIVSHAKAECGINVDPDPD
jgi:hypothetical protein